MKKYEFNPSELTQEKSLWDIYLSSRRIKTTNFNKVVLISTFVLSAIYVFFLQDDTGKILSDCRQLTQIGFSYAISILGFLIAGFTIFATLTKPDLLLRMMDKIHKDTGLTYLKYNYFVFIRVFIFYLGISALYLFGILFCGEGGFIPNLIKFIPESDAIRPNLIRISYVCLTTSLVFLVLLLKVFIFNIYHITMNNLRWEYYEQTHPK